MKPPFDSLRILGKEWSLISKPELIDDDGQSVYGLCDIAEQRILYIDDVTPSQIRDTCLHESIHAIDLSLGLCMTEQQVHAMAAGLFALFRDNPEFKEWL